MGKIIRGMFDSTEETTERNKTRFSFVRTLVVLLLAVFASIWFYREHYTTEELAGSDWSLQYVAGLIFALIALSALGYLWDYLQEARDKGISLWW